jgi:hypothetical protein
MSTKDLAKLSQLHYKIDKNSKKKATKKINKQLEGSDYKLEKLNRGLAVYRHKDGSSVINSKGTNVKNKSDLLSDIKLGLGFQKHDDQFKSRKKDIKKHMLKEPPGSVTLTGHSLGASVITHAMSKSKSIRDNVKKAEVFNTGHTKAFNDANSKGLSKDDKAVLKKKLVHNHVEGDVISTNLTNRDNVGSVKKIKNKKGSLLDKHSLENWTNEKDDPKPDISEGTQETSVETERNE